ncbi:MAG: MotA/TolQ/ExbB proton channel family protein [Pirellulales bacterium]|nr:MotA/TolQ/ExbB proton channel family protein [Pirellulales bacterium]
MDLATLAGLIVAAGCLLYAVVMAGASPLSFFHTSSLLVVCGGTAGALLIAHPLRQLRGWRAAVGPAFRPRPPDLEALAERIVRLAESARREGLLQLEERLLDDDHPTLQLGVRLAIDGTPTEVLEDIVRTECETAGRQQLATRSMLEQIGRMTPAFGLVGTLLGLIIMLGKMSDPTAVGPGMAVALMTTLYGTLVANCLALPLAEKLTHVHRQEQLARELILRGVLALHAGEHPRVIEQRLCAFLPEPPAATSLRIRRAA